MGTYLNERATTPAPIDAKIVVTADLKLYGSEMLFSIFKEVVPTLKLAFTKCRSILNSECVLVLSHDVKIAMLQSRGFSNLLGRYDPLSTRNSKCASTIKPQPSPPTIRVMKISKDVTYNTFWSCFRILKPLENPMQFQTLLPISYLSTSATNRK